MPKLGDRVRGFDIGKAYKSYFVWVACPDCGKERWVLSSYYKRAKAEGKELLCLQCYRKNKLPKLPTGEKHPFWKGKVQESDGYIKVRVYPEDFFYPMADKAGYVREHRLVMAKHLCRCLLDWETVHHKGTKYPSGSIENRRDNRIENLELLPCRRYHDALSRMIKYIKKLEQEIERLRAELQCR